MRKRPRVRRGLKWGGTVFCALLVVAFVVSFLMDVVYDRATTTVRTEVHLVSGAIMLIRQRRLRVPNRRIITFRDIVVMPRDPRLGWWLAVLPRGQGLQRLGFLLLAVPLWMPFVVVGIPTAFFWHRDRRIPPGHCQKCGYDLTDNVSGVCPECGERI